jgi:hypothetical protein
MEDLGSAHEVVTIRSAHFSIRSNAKNLVLEEMNLLESSYGPPFNHHASL